MAAPPRAPTIRTGSGGIVRFAQECWAELQKVTWPDRQTIIRLTVLVLVISAIVAVYIVASDQIFTFLVNRLLLNQPVQSPTPSVP